jgi:hypothetical protein
MEGRVVTGTVAESTRQLRLTRRTGKNNILFLEFLALPTELKRHILVGGGGFVIPLEHGQDYPLPHYLAFDPIRINRYDP